MNSTNNEVLAIFLMKYNFWFLIQFYLLLEKIYVKFKLKIIFII